MPTRLEQLVVDAARRHPDGLALACEQTAWTYRDLDDASRRMAAHLAARGIAAGDRVAVWAPKSCRVVAVLQAVLRVGAAYVPIDPATPAARARKILDDCAVRLIVTTRAFAAALADSPPLFVIDDEEAWSALPDADAWHAADAGGEDDLAYILYTSGSTGTPKGVCISHRNALAFVTWAVDAVGITSRERFANHAPFNFDLSVFDLYGAFLTAGTLHLVPESIAYAAGPLVRFMRTRAISVWYSVPSALVLMIEHGGLLDADGPSPAVVVFAGEPFPIRYVRMLRERWPATRLFNFYGPTETNVCTSHEVAGVPADRTAPVPIGTAASGDRVWAVTEGGTIAGAGERGELYVEGPTVMLGYWGSPRHAGPYRTGDICELRPDGEYEFIGRRDHMIKCRGHRVEPGEIEAALSQHPNVKDVAIAALGAGIDQRLVAFVVPRAGHAPTVLDLKAFGARSLPRYMLVDQVHEMAALPRTANGKLDRHALVLQAS